jgi:hypothetical protein
MDRFKRKTAIALATAGLVALTLGTTTIGAAPLAGNHIVPASTTVSGKSTSTVFSAGGIIVTCTNSVAGGKTPADGLSFAIKPLPSFNDGTSTAPCTDSFGGTDTTVTTGKWSLKFLNPTELEIVVPKAGAVVTNSLGCKITLAPSKAYDVKAPGDYDGVSKLTLNIPTAGGLPVTVTGGLQCPVTAKTASFKAVYTFTPGMADVS